MMQKCVVGLAVVSGSAVASQLRARHGSFQQVVVDGVNYDAPWYSGECDKINDQCEAKKARIRRKYEEDLEELKQEYSQQAKILEEKEKHHANEKADVPPQQKKVVAEQKDVAAAQKEVKDKEHCPPDLQSAESRLAALEAQPNKTPKDIDEECEIKKKIIAPKACVEQLRAGEQVVAKETDQNHDENGELREQTGEENEAAGAVPPQKAKTADAKAAYEAFKRMGVRGIPEVNEECQADRDELERKADADISALENEYQKQKGIFGERVDTHKDEKADVVSQKEKVDREQKDVAEAKKAVQEHEHCPPELEDAQARLSVLEAKPNKTPADVDEECVLKKKILELKACVEKLQAAQAVLAKETDQYHDENDRLSKEHSEESSAASKVPPQKSVVSDLERALAAAKSARKTICLGPDENKKPAPAPAPKTEEPKSGAACITTSLAVFTALFAALVQA